MGQKAGGKKTNWETLHRLRRRRERLTACTYELRNQAKGVDLALGSSCCSLPLKFCTVILTKC
jgi:hypothetical protein